MKIDPTKKYTTRDGKPVEFLHRAPEGWPGHYPWRGFVTKQTMTWTDKGKCFGESTEDAGDLIEVREPLEFEQVVDANGNRFDNRAQVSLAEWDFRWPSSSPHRIAKFREVIP